MGLRKLSRENVAEICELLVNKVPAVEIAKRYNISQSTVSDIRHGRKYKDISCMYELKSNKLSDGIVHEVCRLMAEGKRNIEISKITNLDTDSISRIRTKKSYKHISDLYEYSDIIKKIPDEIVHKVCKMLEDGKRNATISRQLGLDFEAVSNIRRGITYKYISSNYNIKKNSKRRSKVTEEDVHKMCKLLEEGHSNCDIATWCNVSRAQVSAVRNGYIHSDISKNYNIERRPKESKQNSETVENICRLLQEGKTALEISKLLKISRGNVYIIKSAPAYDEIRSRYGLNNNVKEDENDDISNE